MIKGEICFKTGILYMSESIQEMIANRDNIRKIEEKFHKNFICLNYLFL